MRGPGSCPRPVAGRVLVNGSTGEFLPLPCGTWGCSSCGPAKAHRLGVLAAAAAPQRFITLSKVGPDLDSVYRGLQTLSQALRRSGYGWEYLTVPEVHQNGFWHLHLLQKGSYIPQKVLSERAESAGMGRVVDIRRIQDRDEVPLYLCKYLTKQTLAAGIERGKKSKRFRTSRGFWPGGYQQHKTATWPTSSSLWRIERTAGDVSCS